MCTSTALKRLLQLASVMWLYSCNLGPVLTNPFSNENGTFKKICVHTYRFRIVFACPHYNADQERSHMVASVRHFGYGLTVELVWRPVVSILMTSPFQIVSCSPSTLENIVSKSIVFKSLHSGEGFRMAPFSVIVSGVVVWTIAVSGAKQPRFCLKTN